MLDTISNTVQFPSTTQQSEQEYIKNFIESKIHTPYVTNVGRHLLKYLCVTPDLISSTVDTGLCDHIVY